MIMFAAPAWLIAMPLVGILGVWALWRGRHHVQRVSSTRLWEGLTGEASGKKSRHVDPVWLMVFLASLLAGLALAGPRWQSATDPQVATADVHWAIRGIAGQTQAELFVRIERDQGLSGTCKLIVAPTEMDEFTGVVKQFSVADLRQGMVVQVPNFPELQATLTAGPHVLAKSTFIRRDRPPFALLTAVARGGKIDPALLRLFSVHPSVTTDDPTIRPAVLLVDDPRFEADSVDARTLVIASPRTPLPGNTLKQVITPAAPARPQSAQLNLAAVRVNRYTSAELSSDWEILATLDGHPWIAMRTESATPTAPLRRSVWLASNPAQDGNWGVDLSFVLFFGELLDQMYPATVGTAPSDVGVVEWTERRDTSGEPSPTVAPISLMPGAGLAAIVLLASASLLLFRRAHLPPA